MSGTKHTPGQWADYDNDLPRTLSRADYSHAVRCVNVLDGINPEAVPDLLAALEEIDADAEDSGDCADGMADALARIARTARAAIKKARGDS